jgi:hypothetical protein
VRGDRDGGGGGLVGRLGNGVADIAGGGGVLSFELHVRHGLPCTLVDPRHVGLSPRQLNTWRNLRKRGAVAGEGSVEWAAWLRADQWVRIAAAEEQSRHQQHLKQVLTYTDAAMTSSRADLGAGAGSGATASSATAARSDWTAVAGAASDRSEAYSSALPSQSAVGVGAALAAATPKEGEMSMNIMSDRRLVSDSNAGALLAVPSRSEKGGALFQHLASEFWGDVDGPVGRSLTHCDVLVGRAQGLGLGFWAQGLG